MKNKYEIAPIVMLLASILIIVIYFTYVFPMMKTNFERILFTIIILIPDILLFYTSLKNSMKTYFHKERVVKKVKRKK